MPRSTFTGAGGRDLKGTKEKPKNVRPSDLFTSKIIIFDEFSADYCSPCRVPVPAPHRAPKLRSNLGEPLERSLEEVQRDAEAGSRDQGLQTAFNICASCRVSSRGLCRQSLFVKNVDSDDEERALSLGQISL